MRLRKGDKIRINPSDTRDEEGQDWYGLDNKGIWCEWDGKNFLGCEWDGFRLTRYSGRFPWSPHELKGYVTSTMINTNVTCMTEQLIADGNLNSKGR